MNGLLIYTVDASILLAQRSGTEVSYRQEEPHVGTLITFSRHTPNLHLCEVLFQFQLRRGVRSQSERKASVHTRGRLDKPDGHQEQPSVTKLASGTDTPNLTQIATPPSDPESENGNVCSPVNCSEIRLHVSNQGDTEHRCICALKCDTFASPDSCSTTRYGSGTSFAGHLNSCVTPPRMYTVTCLHLWTPQI